MTLKQFSRKYCVPYHIVYESSYKVQPQSTWLHDRDYPEWELYDAVRDTVRQRIIKHKKLLDQQTEIYRRMKKDALSEVQTG